MRRVNFHVTHTRVGQMTNYDKLTLEVWTDGTTSGVDAISKSADILVDELRMFALLGKPAPPVVERGLGIGTSLSPDKYNIPIELLYTAVPTIMVAVLFYFTAKDESQLLKITNDQATSINVVGRQWSWSFNYNYDAATGQQFTAGGPSVYEAGTPGQPPHLYLPLGEKVKFTLTSPDVIHSFWVPAFLFKLDVVPGRVNQFELTPTKQGEFIGECAEAAFHHHESHLRDRRPGQRDLDRSLRQHHHRAEQRSEAADHREQIHRGQRQRDDISEAQHQEAAG